MENKNYNNYGSYDTGYSAYEAAKDTVPQKPETTELNGPNDEQNNSNKSKNYGFIGSTSTTKYSNPYDNNAYGDFTSSHQKRSSKRINKKATSNETPNTDTDSADVDVTQVQYPVVYYASPQTVPAIYYSTPVTPVTPVAIQYVNNPNLLYQDGSESGSSKGKRDSKRLPTSYFGDKENVEDEVEKTNDKEKEYEEIMNELGIRPKDNQPQDLKSKLIRNQLLIFISILILFVIFMVLYFVWPRMPNITITDFSLGDDPIQYKLPIDIEYRDEFTDLTNVTDSDVDSYVRFNLITHFDVKNNNYLPYKFNSLNLDYVLKGESLRNNVLLGRNFIEEVEFGVRKKMTMTVTTTLAYAAKSMKNDDTFGFILQKCGITGKGSKMDIDYKMSVKIPMLFFTYYPSETKTALFECPFLREDKYRVIEKKKKDDEDKKDDDKNDDENKDKKNEDGKENNQNNEGDNKTKNQ